MSRTRLRNAAPALLKAAREALAHFISADPLPAERNEEKRQVLIEKLRMAIDAAEGPNSFDEAAVSVTLVMTKTTAKSLIEAVTKRRSGEDHEMERVYEAVTGCIRRTKQRVYIRLGIDHAVLKRLRLILMTTNRATSGKAFVRLAKQI